MTVLVATNIKYTRTHTHSPFCEENFSDPTEQNDGYIDEIERRKLEAEQAASDTTEMIDSHNTNNSTIFNIMIAHPIDIEVDPKIGQKEGHYNQPLKHYHSLPLESLSLDHLDNFKNLINKELYIVGEEKDSLLMDLLEVTAEHTQHGENIPKQFYPSQRSAEQLQLALPSNELLKQCSDKEIKPIEEKFKRELESHRGVSGYFFCDEELNFFSRKFFSLPLSVSDIETKEALASFKLLDVFYTEKGDKDYCRRITSTLYESPNTTSKFFDLKVCRGREKTLNVSRFATPLLCSVLVSHFLCIPRDNKLLILSPDVFVSFRVHTKSGPDFIRVEISGTGEDTDKIWSYFFSMLQSVKVMV